MDLKDVFWGFVITILFFIIVSFLLSDGDKIDCSESPEARAYCNSLVNDFYKKYPGGVYRD